MKKFLPLFLLLPLSVAFACFLYIPNDIPFVHLLRWRLRAAAGDASAQYLVGWMYLDGRGGLPRDEKLAALWLRKSADKGNDSAETVLASMYLKGQAGLPRDNAQAMDLFQKAAVHGNIRAQLELGGMYQRGDNGSPPDDLQAAYWYKLVADRSNVGGMTDLAWLYATSKNPGVRNPALAFQYASKAADITQDFPTSNILNTLAECYYVNQKYQDAVTTQQKAIALLPPTAKPERRKDYEDRLDQYQSALKQDTKRKK